MTEITVKIEGMSCGHCVMRVKKAVDELSGVTSSEVNIGKARVVYDESRLKRQEIEKAIEKAGYSVAA